MPLPTPIRTYQPIWEALKKKKKCTLAVNPLLFARVRKAVSKEKRLDLAFKVLNDHDYFFLKITTDKKKHTMTFELKQRFGLEGIVS